MSQLSNQASIFLKQNEEKKIVFTNGCFDILHRGHLEYLKEARALGDLLFLGLNSDLSINKLKGDGRPINNEDDRKFFLESLRYVDFVEVFSEQTPLELIKNIRPHILVKGGDWEVNQIVGHDVLSSYGGIVKSLSFKQGYSTTNIIKTLQGKQ